MTKKAEDFSLALHHLLKKRGIPDDIILEVFRLMIVRLIERCDDPAHLDHVYFLLGGRGFPYDEKFAQAVRKAEAHDALKKTLRVIDGEQG